MFMLSGTIYITDKIEQVRAFPVGPASRIINLDEDDVLPENNPFIIGGQCLLPPINSKIAEADGNEMAYDMYYKENLLRDYQETFIAALISFLYKGGSLLLFLPELGYSLTADKLIQFIYELYGIHIAKLGYEDNEFHKITPDELACWYNANAPPVTL